MRATGWLLGLVEGVHELVARAAEHGHVAVHPHHAFVNEDVVRVAHDAGIAVNTWRVDKQQPSDVPDPALLVQELERLEGGDSSMLHRVRRREARAARADVDHVAVNTDNRAQRWRKLAYVLTSGVSPGYVAKRLRARAERLGTPFVPFDKLRGYDDYVDGKPREDGTRSFLESRGITLPEGIPGMPNA